MWSFLSVLNITWRWLCQIKWKVACPIILSPLNENTRHPTFSSWLFFIPIILIFGYNLMGVLTTPVHMDLRTPKLQCRPPSCTVLFPSWRLWREWPIPVFRIRTLPRSWKANMWNRILMNFVLSSNLLKHQNMQEKHQGSERQGYYTILRFLSLLVTGVLLIISTLHQW